MAEPGVVRNHDGAYRYDTEKNKWSSLRSLPQPNRGLSAVADGRRMYLLGGYTDKGFSPDVFAFDLSGQTYQQVAALPFALLGFELVVSGHSVYIAGGEDKPRGRSGRLLFAELPR